MQGFSLLRWPFGYSEAKGCVVINLVRFSLSVCVCACLFAILTNEVTRFVMLVCMTVLRR